MGEYSNYQEVCYFTKQHAGRCATREKHLRERRISDDNKKARKILRLRFN